MLESRLYSSLMCSSGFAVLPLGSQNAARLDRQANASLVYSQGIFAVQTTFSFFLLTKILILQKNQLNEDAAKPRASSAS